MTRAGLWLAAIAMTACSGSEEQSDPAGQSCEHAPYTGLEPACDFEPGPPSGLTEPPASVLPTPTGPCPSFSDGDGCVPGMSGALNCTFQPQGQATREARVWLPPGGRTTAGPLVIYFYGLLGFPENAVTPVWGFPADALQKLYDAGGILVAPQARADRTPPKLSRLPWIDALGLEGDAGDFELVDEIVACASQGVGIDARRIHITGLSAGAWMTAQVAVNRSSYVASVALFSGGLEHVSGTQDPRNKYPVAMFHGGPNDNVGAHFQNEAQSGVNLWRALGHFAVNCNHGGGHTVPPSAGLAGMQFMLDHPYGTLQSPYCDAPAAGTEFCALSTPADGGITLAPYRSQAEITACQDQATSLGVIGGRFNDDMLSCSCERCGADLEACLADPACLPILQCAAEKGCLGINCYQDALCAPAIDAAGGPLDTSPQLAVALSDCVGAAACDWCGVPRTRAP